MSRVESGVQAAKSILARLRRGLPRRLSRGLDLNPEKL